MADQAAPVYLAFLDALNNRDLDRAEAAVDVERLREICVGFTDRVIKWSRSRASMEPVWAGIPDVQFERYPRVPAPRLTRRPGRRATASPFSVEAAI